MEKATWIAVVVGISLFLVVGVLLLVNKADRPILEITTYRECDFVEIAGTVRVVCLDGTRWTVVQDDVPLPHLPSSLPMPESKSMPIGESVKVRYSHYWPPLGGVNCADFRGGKCVSNMASGKAWADYVGEAVACPPEMPFGTLILLDGKVWTCLDRGGLIRYVDGVAWLDFLTEKGTHAYGDLVTVQIIKSL